MTIVQLLNSLRKDAALCLQHVQHLGRGGELDTDECFTPQLLNKYGVLRNKFHGMVTPSLMGTEVQSGFVDFTAIVMAGAESRGSTLWSRRLAAIQLYGLADILFLAAVSLLPQSDNQSSANFLSFKTSRFS